MIYKLEYQFNDDPSPHQRYYTALSPDIATAMFEATCEDGSLSGERVTLLSIKEMGDIPPEECVETCVSE